MLVVSSCIVYPVLWLIHTKLKKNYTIVCFLVILLTQLFSFMDSRLATIALFIGGGWICVILLQWVRYGWGQIWSSIIKSIAYNSSLQKNVFLTKAWTLQLTFERRLRNLYIFYLNPASFLTFLTQVIGSFVLPKAQGLVKIV